MKRKVQRCAQILPPACNVRLREKREDVGSFGGRVYVNNGKGEGEKDHNHAICFGSKGSTRKEGKRKDIQRPVSLF